MLVYLKSKWWRWSRFVNRYCSQIITILINANIMIFTSCLMCTRMHQNRFEILIYNLSYIILQLIVGYARSVHVDSETQLMKLKHKRFTEETSSGLIRVQKSRLSEMVQFVYHVEEIMDDLQEFEK